MQALENLFYLFGLDEVQSASQSGARSISKAQAEALIRMAVEKSDVFEEAFDAICRYAGRLASLSTSDLANLMVGDATAARQRRLSGKHARARKIRLIADDVIEEHRAKLAH